jgi:hypothetical protein
MPSLLNKVKVADLTADIHDNCRITRVDPNPRKNRNGEVIKRNLFITFAKFKEDKKIGETELSWWTPDPTSEFFIINLRMFCFQIIDILKAFMSYDEAVDKFKDVFSEFEDITDTVDIESKKWKKSEVKSLMEKLNSIFSEAIKPYINSSEQPLRVKMVPNYKGEDTDIPSKGSFVEPMIKKESDLKFDDFELRLKSKAGTVSKKNMSENTTL